MLLAAYMTLGFAQTPWQAVDVNIRGAQNLLEACRVNKVRKLVFASSNAVYGYGPGISGALTETIPFHSTGAPPAAILYGASKIIGEQLCRQAYQKSSLDYVRASLFHRVRGKTALSRREFAVHNGDVRQDKRGERPILPGDGSETKHFVYVGDVARAKSSRVRKRCHGCRDERVGAGSDNHASIGPIGPRLLREALSFPKQSLIHPERVRLTSGGAFHIPTSSRAARSVGNPACRCNEGGAKLLAWREAQEKKRGAMASAALAPDRQSKTHTRWPR